MIDCSKLTELDLSHNNIGPKGAEKLAFAFERMMRLETLILENVKLEGSGMIFLCGGLINSRNLKVLSIGENKIGSNFLIKEGGNNVVTKLPSSLREI